MLLLLQASDDTCTKMPSQAESPRQEMCEHAHFLFAPTSLFTISQAEFVHCDSLIYFIRQNSFKDEIYIAYTRIMRRVIALCFNICKVNKALAQSQICIPSLSIQLAHITSKLILEK